MGVFTVHLLKDSYIVENGEIRSIGDIYIQIDNHFFPEIGWYDFGENLLSWWSEEFAKLLTGKETKVRCGFMDGPYRFDVLIISKGVWQVTCFDERENQEVREYEAEVDALQASDSLLKAVDLMLSLFQEKGDKKSFDFLNERKQSLVTARRKMLTDVN